MENFSNYKIMESKSSECKTCKSPGLNVEQKWLFVLAIYILVSSIYGTIQLVKDIANFFTSI